MAYSLDGAIYTSRMPLPYNGHSHIAGDLTDPMCVAELDSGDSDFWDFGPPVSGNGVRFALADGTLLEFHTEQYNTGTETGIWHVKIPTLSSTVATKIYIYYEVDVETDGSNRAATLDANYIRAYHCNEDETGGAFVDATGNENLTDDGTSSVAARIGKGRRLDGATDSLKLSTGGLAADLHGKSALTFETTFSLETLDAVLQYIASWEIATSGTALFACFVNGTTDVLQFGGRSQLADAFQNTTAGTLTAGQTYHLVAQLDLTNDKIYLYLDEVAVVNGFAVTFGSTTFVDSNNQANNDSFFEGSTGGSNADAINDETTISDTLRSADWVIARNQSGLRTWMTPGSRETSDALDTLTLTDSLLVDKSVTISEDLTLDEAIEIVSDSARDTLTLDDTVLVDREITVDDTLTLDEDITKVGSLSLMFGTKGFPSGQTVEYRIEDDGFGLLQDWTSVGVIESVVITGKSNYLISGLELENGFQGVISWRIPGTSYYSSEFINYLDSWIVALSGLPSMADMLSTLVPAIWDRVLSKANHNIGQSSGKRLRQLDALTSADASINDASPTASSFITTLPSTIDSFYEDMSVVIVDDADLTGQSRVCSDYNGTTKEISFDEPFSQVPVDGSDIIVFSPHVHPVSEIANAVLDEALAGHTTAGTLGKALADIETDTTLLISYVKNKKYIAKDGSTWYLYIRNDGDSDNILKKAIKDKAGADITDIVAGVLTVEMESSV